MVWPVLVRNDVVDTSVADISATLVSTTPVGWGPTEEESGAKEEEA